ncbi:MAG: sodium-dependent transporter [Clostridia bacterium]|nr:sodium-dependent transporter [Clostridia bacterium]
MNQAKRNSFTGKIGFVLAAAGSAVGLGNIWRFPYLAAKYGGGIFLLVYLALSVTFGFTLMVAEIAIGRKTQQSPIGAYKALHKRFGFIGILASVIPVLILPYYSVIGGWVMKYAVGFFVGSADEMAQSGFFGSYIGELSEPVLWFLAFIVITAVIVLCGVQKGIEKVSKIMMPVLIVLMLFIVIYSLCTIDGAIDGLIYYLKPDFSHFGVKTVIAAMGQLFYSMSLAMGIMITFGSYMKKDISIEKSTHQIEIFDTGIAFLAGLMIVPACFAFSGGDPAALGAGPGLMFGVLPQVFDAMPAGNLIGAAFFAMVLLAALTSSISLMETIVSTLHDKWKVNRTVACLLVLDFSVVLGVLSCLGYSTWSDFSLLGLQILDFFDFITNNLMMPLVALATCIMVSYFIKPKTVIEEIELSGKFRQKTLFSAVIRFVAPICLVVILVWAVMGTFTSIELFQL